MPHPEMALRIRDSTLWRAGGQLVFGDARRRDAQCHPWPFLANRTKFFRQGGGLCRHQGHRPVSGLRIIDLAVRERQFRNMEYRSGNGQVGNIHGSWPRRVCQPRLQSSESSQQDDFVRHLRGRAWRRLREVFRHTALAQFLSPQQWITISPQSFAIVLTRPNDPDEALIVDRNMCPYHGRRFGRFSTPGREWPR